MRIELKIRAAGVRDAQATARIDVEPPGRDASGARRWIGSAVASIIGVASAVTALPEISARLSPRVVLALHFIATVGTSAQPVIVTIIAAGVAALEHAVRSCVLRERAAR